MHSMAEILEPFHLIAGVVQKLRELYNPIMTHHRVDAEHGAEMIALHASDQRGRIV